MSPSGGSEWPSVIDTFGDTTEGYSENSGSLRLLQNYPNPFNSSTNVKFVLYEHDFVTLTIFNMSGEAVKTLLEKSLAPGYYTATWTPIAVPSRLCFCPIVFRPMRQASRNFYT